MKRKLYINYENGTGMSLSCFTLRDAYRLAFRIIRGAGLCSIGGNRARNDLSENVC